MVFGTDGTAQASFTTDRLKLRDVPDNYANIPSRYAAAGPDDMTLAKGDSGGWPVAS
jgi:Cu-Zn family superoxide dismutase